MRKVTKIFLLGLAIITVVVVWIPLLLGISLYIPSVQKFAVNKVTRIVSDKIGTEVSLGAVHLKLFNTASFDDLYVGDHFGDTLLYVKKLKVGITDLGLRKTITTFGKISLDDAKFYLYHDSVGTSNLRHVLLKFSSDKEKEKDTTAVFKLNAHALDIKNLSFRNHKNPEPQKGVNTDDVDITGFNFRGKNISVIDDSISLVINEISFRDKSGFSLDGFACKKFNISGSGIRFNDLKIKTPDSQLQMDYLRMLTGTWQGYMEFMDDVYFETAMQNSTVGFKTISYFAPSLETTTTVITDVNCIVEGCIADLKGKVEYARTGSSTLIKTAFEITGIPEMSTTLFKLSGADIVTCGDDIRLLTEDFTGKQFDDLKPYLNNLDTVKLKLNFDGTFSDFVTAIDMNTNLGRVNAGLTLSSRKSGLHVFHGSINTDKMNVGTILSLNELGRTSMSAEFKGVVGADSLLFDTDAHIALLELNGYKYHDINVVGNVNQKIFTGDVVSQDSNIRFDFKGLLDFSRPVPRYDFGLSLDRADLSELNLNERDSISLLSCKINARGIGSTIDNINGRINISDLRYINHLDSMEVGDIVITGRNNDTRKYIAVNSDVLDLEFRSKMSYHTLFDYIQRSINNYLPTLTDYDSKQIEIKTTSSDDPNDVNNYSIVRLNIKEINNVASIFLPGLQLATGTSLSLMINPDANTLNFSFNSDYIEKGDFFASNINLNGRNNQADSLLVYLSAKDIYSGKIHIPGINILGGAKNNSIKLSAGYTYPDKGNSALLALTSSLERDSITNMRQVRIRIEPSSFNSGEQNWRIVSRDIIYDSTKVTIDDFRILGSGQELRIRGAISPKPTDSLSIILNNFNLGSLSDFIKIAGYDIQGYSNGSANIISVTGDGILTADVSFDSLRINRIDVPRVIFRSKWDFSRGGAGFEISRLDKNETVLRGLYKPSDNELFAKLTFSDMDMSLLDPVLEGILKNNKGVASTNIDLHLKDGKLDMNGAIEVNEFSTWVNFLNVPYKLKQTKVDVNNSVFTIKGASLDDPLNNSAAFEMKLDLGSFSNIKYDINIKPSNMLVLNTTMEQNNLFYGTVYASGNATIKGDKKTLNMDISATTSSNSKFYMPLSGKREVSTADFIVFKSSDKLLDTTNVLTRRRLMFEQRQKLNQDSDKADMNIVLNINVTPNTDFQLVIDPEAGDMIRARGNGALRLNIRPANNELTMFGDYEITEGIYHLKLRNLFDKKFAINPGSVIRWTGDPIDATLDINAVYKLKASLYPLTNDLSMRRKVPVECDIKLTDKLSQPTVAFGVRVPNADPETHSIIDYALNTQEQKAKQFVWLAATGSFAANENGGFNISGSTNSMGYDVLFNQLSNMISSDKLAIGVHYTPAGELNSDEVNVELQAHVFSDRLILEFEGNYDTQNNPATTSNPNSLSGNLAATWLIDPSGNLMAKGFTRTIDRFDETQGQQESGIGIYYKEDFDKVQDIIVNLRKRFSKKWRNYYKQEAAERNKEDKENIEQ